jgi:hypothetical protein
MRITVLLITATTAIAALSFTITLGHTLVTIENRQRHEDEAIKCMLDFSCLKAISGKHGVAAAKLWAYHDPSVGAHVS